MLMLDHYSDLVSFDELLEGPWQAKYCWDIPKEKLPKKNIET